MNGGLRIVLLVACLACAARAQAHERSSSRSVWRFEGHAAQVVLTLHAHDLAQLSETLPTDPLGVARYGASALLASSDDGPCRVDPDSMRVLGVEADQVRVQWRLDCPSPSGLQIESQLFERTSPGHLHFLQARTPDGATTHNLLSEGRRRATLGHADGGQSEGFAAWVGLGAEHVLTGYDHLAFVLALLVGATSLGALAWTLTGFTLGHAFTLALAVLGTLHANVPLVEALIGLSIVVVAVENAWMRSALRRVPWPLALPAAVLLTLPWLAIADRSALGWLALALAAGFGLRARITQTTALRASVACGFGLVHGLGFASALGEHGLPREGLVAALVGFNAGVELGQLAAAALAWTLLLGLARSSATLHARTLDLANAAVCAAGVYWTITRLV